ncbi:MAG TPA: glucose-6-phosphate dehydrogenase assembly protein OpcA [Ktedonobacteraceae bacterium]
MLKDHADNNAAPRLSWAGKKVRAADIEGELSRLWHMSADNVRMSHNINVRTSVLNFVICAPDTATAQQASMLIRDLASTHIARVVLLILDTSDLPSSVSTWVTLRSFPMASDLMRHHFEQITVMISGAARHDAAQIIQPLFKQDLPAYLWWLHDFPTDIALLRRISSHCNRVIVDSSTFTRPVDSMSDLSALVRDLPNCAFSDLNWTRISPWRELIAQFFDVAEYRPYITGVNQITIEHAAASSSQARNTTGSASQEGSSNPLQAVLLSLWLKACLGWTHTSDDETSIYDPAMQTYTWPMARHTGTLSPGRSSRTAPSSIVLHARTDSDVLPGSICLVRLDSLRDDNRRASFHIHRDDDLHVTTFVELDQGSRPPRTVHLAAEQNAYHLLHNELEMTCRDTLYEEALHEVFDLTTKQRA